ncbi:MAG: hypothetical protein WBD56_16305 [Anaerolineales bacterium]
MLGLLPGWYTVFRVLGSALMQRIAPLQSAVLSFMRGDLNFQPLGSTAIFGLTRILTQTLS